MGFGTKNHKFLEGLGSCRTDESDGKNSQPKISRMEEGKQQQLGVNFIGMTDYELNSDLEDKEEVSFGGFHDGPAIARGSGHKSYCKRKLESSYEFNKRSRYMDHPTGGIERPVHSKIFNSVGLGDEESRMRNSCKTHGHSGFNSYVTETPRDSYNNTEIFKGDITHINALSHDRSSFCESYDVVTGSMLPLRLKDVAERSKPSLSFPLVDGGNYLLGEPLRDIISDTNGTYQSTESTSINNKSKNNLSLIGAYDKENVIDPRVIFKFEANSRFLGGSKRVCNNLPCIPLPQENNSTLGCLNTNRNSRIDMNISKHSPLIPAVDENILQPQKNTIMLTYPTPDRVSDREYNTHIYNKAGTYTSDIVDQEQNGFKKTEAPKTAAKNKPKLSQKLLYIHNLSRSSNTKIDETVAYLHYKLRGYENMAVSTRIRNILQSHQSNLIGICGQLGIPELLVPRRTN
ncbi:DEHA2G24508p [Debaryomyces hansenii CBS767]|uniref:DEHA2G24508p n=1 Tax=Debaryomyces hansenii (strain ATCC 36239 / CBS 767 / BCRC 21394 / JCM 1990 / NBRC 0083 / IGC 2968) TaxID=284592 RepID=Q6BGR4_DEBHA|nr:DEHA2G24508p [Debaryomyces hansenii CBS767]CAG91122.2 DEHA2G24508p [Debaryomyces hansenii CBS767]|eukprot:XP_462607.2 DEHA2G24508p [Debaryomyces hansenii CBS767]